MSLFNKCFSERYNEDGDERYFLEVDAQYPGNLLALHNYLSFLTERMKIEKVEKLVANWLNKKDVTNIWNLK